MLLSVSFDMILVLLAVLSGAAQGLLAAWRRNGPVRRLLLGILPALGTGALLVCLWYLSTATGWGLLGWDLALYLPVSVLFGTAAGWLIGLNRRKRGS